MKKTDEVTAIFVLEYASQGSLIHNLLNHGKLNENVAKYYLKKLVSALSHLHAHGVAHRDIKPDNILLDSKFNLKLADFGMAGVKETEDQLFSEKIGTGQYLAPEVNGKNEYDGFKADIYSTGVTLFTMATGIPPYQEASSKDPYFKCIKKGDWTSFWNFH